MEFFAQQASSGLKTGAPNASPDFESLKRNVNKLFDVGGVDALANRCEFDKLEQFNDAADGMIKHLMRERARTRPIEIDASAYNVTNSAGSYTKSVYRDGELFVFGEKDGQPVVLDHSGRLDLPLDMGGKIEKMRVGKDGKLYFVIKNNENTEFVMDDAGQRLMNEDGFSDEYVHDLCVDDDCNVIAVTHRMVGKLNIWRLYGAGGVLLHEGNTLGHCEKYGRWYYMEVGKHLLRSDGKMSVFGLSRLIAPTNFGPSDDSSFIAKVGAQSAVYDKDWKKDSRFTKLEECDAIFKAGKHIYIYGVRRGKKCLEREDGVIHELPGYVYALNDIVAFGDSIALVIEIQKTNVDSEHRVIDLSGNKVIANPNPKSKPQVQSIGGTIYLLSAVPVDRHRYRFIYTDQGEQINFESNIMLNTAQMYDLAGNFVVSGVFSKVGAAVFNRQGKKISGFYDQIYNVEPIADKPGCAWVVARKGKLFVKHEIDVTRELPIETADLIDGNVTDINLDVSSKRSFSFLGGNKVLKNL